ncbi:MAG: hypothetical protein KatS3mg103_0881 [Phycisphaerales bacterium]|nr:MAG: hypothetical protein KatS3mg103_0881 [Phycisphaerales bacterium]
MGPTFKGTPFDANPGVTYDTRWQNISNNSYAQVTYFGARNRVWSNTFSSTDAILGNRGPQYQARGSGESLVWELPESLIGDQSKTLLIHGPRPSGRATSATTTSTWTSTPAPTPRT